jgi:hypothetical protein
MGGEQMRSIEFGAMLKKNRSRQRLSENVSYVIFSSYLDYRYTLSAYVRPYEVEDLGKVLGTRIDLAGQAEIDNSRVVLVTDGRTELLVAQLFQNGSCPQ